jgi:hypothetical protein
MQKFNYKKFAEELAWKACDDNHATCNYKCPAYAEMTDDETRYSNCPLFKDGKKMVAFIRKRQKERRYDLPITPLKSDPVCNECKCATVSHEGALCSSCMEEHAKWMAKSFKPVRFKGRIVNAQ